MTKVTVIFVDTHRYNEVFADTLGQALLTITPDPNTDIPTLTLLNGKQDAAINTQLQDGDVIMCTSRSL